MVEKVKVSRKVANFLEKCKNSGDINWEDAVLHEHIKIFESQHKQEAVEINPNALCMLQYSPFELARILVLGHEIEETPKEKALAYYNSFDYTPLGEATEKMVIRKFLKLAEIKFEGINE